MKKCKDCHIFCQQSDNGGICGMSNFGTVSFDDGCRVGDIFDSIYKHGYNKALEDFRKNANDFLNESSDFADFVITDTAIDRICDKLRK